MAIEDDAPLFADFNEIDAVWWLEMGDSMLDDNEYGLVSTIYEKATEKYSPQETLDAIRAVIEADVKDYVNDMDDSTLMGRSSDEELKRAVLSFVRKAYRSLAEQLGE